MQQIYQSPASRPFVFSTLLMVILVLVFCSCEIMQDVSMIEDPYPVEFKDGKLYPDDYGSYKQFGRHIDIWENYALIGCGKENGAYVFRNDGNQWKEIEKLELRANYGIGDVCFKEDWILVGTEYANGSGKVDVFRFGDEEIEFVQEIHSNAKEDRFGSAIDVSGDYMIIGAKAPWNECENCGTNSDPGKAFIYKLNGDQWTLEADFDANPPMENDGFGREVAISGNFAFVKGGNKDTVYVYSNLEGQWAFHSYLCPEPVDVLEKEFEQRFGKSIHVDGTNLMIGAPTFPVSGLQDRLGAVYHYELQEGNTWVFREKILNPNSVPGDEVNEFGSTLKLEGDYMIVGGNNTNYIGGGVVYKYSGSKWVNIHYISPPDDLVSHGFGISMDISDQWMLVGHVGDMDTGTEAGAVYVFENNY